MSDDKKSGSESSIIKVILVIMLTLVPSYVCLWLLTIVPFGPTQLKLQAFLLSGIIFFLGACVLTFSQISKHKFLLWLSGFVITLGAVIIGGALFLVQLALLFPLEAAVISCILVSLALLLFRQRVSTTTKSAASGVPHLSLFFSAARIFFALALLSGVGVLE